MTDGTTTLAGLPALTVGDRASAETVVVLAHGFAMVPGDLSPFARSLGVPAYFLFPEAPLVAPTTGRAWWTPDMVRRAEDLAAGPRDLFAEHPPGLDEASRCFAAFVVEAKALAGARRLVIGGFSQGGMLALDALLKSDLPHVDAAFLLSASRIALGTWTGRSLPRGLPVLVAHGRADDDLAFAAGESLRDFVIAAGADVTWVPFDGGHQIPLGVWRALKKLVRALSPAP